MAETYKIGVKSLDFEEIAVAASAVGFDAPAGTVRAVCGVETNPIRYRVDGEDPSSSEGFLVKADETFEIVGPEAIGNFKAIQDGAAGQLNVIYYG